MIERLFDQAPEASNALVDMMKAEGNANATRKYIDCQLTLKSGYAMAGILTTGDGFYDFGELRMCSVAKTADGKVVIADQRFSCEEIEIASVERALPEQLVKPANPTRNGSPIILG